MYYTCGLMFCLETWVLRGPELLTIYHYIISFFFKLAQTVKKLINIGKSLEKATAKNRSYF